MSEVGSPFVLILEEQELMQKGPNFSLHWGLGSDPPHQNLVYPVCLVPWIHLKTN